MAAVTQTAANVRAGSGAIVATAVAGEAFAAGQPLYLSALNGKYLKSDADDSDKSTIKGVAMTGATADGDTFVILTGGTLNIGGSTVVGQIYIVGSAGGIHPASDLASTWYPVIVGPAIDTLGNIEFIGKSGSAAMA